MRKTFSHYKFASNSSKEYFESSFYHMWSGGGIYGVVSIKSDDQDTEKIGKLIQETSLDLVMNSVEEDRIKLLKEVLGNAKDTFSSAANKDIEAISQEAALNLGIVLLLENVIYVGILGGARCFINRLGKTLDLSGFIEKSELPVFSGQLLQTDSVLLTAQEGKLPVGDFERMATFVSNTAGFVLGDELTVAQLVERLENAVETEVKEESVAENEPENVEPVVETVIETKENLVISESDDQLEEVPVVAPVDQQPEVRAESDKFKKIREFFAKVFERISPAVQKVSKVLVEKLGGIVTWVYETVVGSGKKVGRYQMPGGDSIKRRRLLLLFSIAILMIGLYFSISWVGDRNYVAEQKESYDSLYSQIETVLLDAEAKSTYSVDETNLLLTDARSQIDQLEQYEVEENDAQSLRQRVLQLQDLVEGRVRFEEFDVVDLMIPYENADPTDIIFYNNYLLLTDPKARAVYKIDENDNVSQVLSSSDGLREPMYLEVVEDIVYIYDMEEGVLAYSPDAEEKIKKVTGLSTATLGNVTEISGYGGSLYFLIADEGKILKSSPAGSGFSYPQIRLQDESFRTAKDLEINGLIYTLGEGELVRFYVDTKDNQLTISGVTPEIGVSNKFDLLASLKVLMLDGDNKRLVVLNQPQGNSSIFKLDKQYSVSDEEGRYFNDLREVTVDPITNTVYILDGFRVIKVGLDE